MRHLSCPAWLVVFLLVGLSLNAAGLAEDTPSPAALKKRFQVVYDKASPAIVRITVDDNRQLAATTGVIVSKDGTIVSGGPRDMMRQPAKATVHFAEGRRVKAQTLGWSNEFRITVLKIVEAGPWPYVKLAKSGQGKTGDLCVGIGYDGPALPGKKLRPAIYTGRVNRTAGPIWGTTTFAKWGFGHGVFGLDGQLIGVTTHQAAHFFRDLKPNPNGDRDPVHTRSQVIREHWSALTAGKNLDQLRLRAAKTPQTADLGGKTKTTERQIQAAIAKAKLASIRLRRAGSDDPNGGSSGVVISADGYIVTCAHHFLLPGDKLTITFADGSEVAGEILGTNWVTDICVAKITQKGKWPHAPLASSLSLNSGTPCLTLGYPARRQRNRKLAPRKLSIKRTKISKNDGKSISSRVASNGLRISGESGGGLFDIQGRVVGVAESLNRNQTTDHVRIEMFLLQWKYLTQKKRP